jgi:2-C-methyl-D-erythritol 4-phosphate cytidylyltransferase
VNREGLFNALTPQVFSYGLILKAHEKAEAENLFFTDDASLLEYYGLDVFTVETSAMNFKITVAEDLELAELILKNKL